MKIQREKSKTTQGNKEMKEESGDNKNKQTKQ
jgi:hypothetical protein